MVRRPSLPASPTGTGERRVEPPLSLSGEGSGVRECAPCMATAAPAAGRWSGIGLAQQFLALAAEALLFELQLLLLTRLRHLGKDLLQLQVALDLFVVLLALALRLVELAPFDFLALGRRQRGIEAFLKLALPQQQLVLVLPALQQLPLHPARGRLRERNLGAQTGACQAARHGTGAQGTTGYHGHPMPGAANDG